MIQRKQRNNAASDIGMLTQPSMACSVWLRFGLEVKENEVDELSGYLQIRQDHDATASASPPGMTLE